MGVPCTPISTVEVAAGPGITVSFLGGVYTVSADTADADLISNYKVYATEAARDLDNPSPSSGDAAWSQADDTLWWHDGTGWIIMREPEQTYTPTWANVTLGTSPTRTGRYRRSNGLIYIGGQLILGTGGALTGAPTMSMPSGITLGQSHRGTARFSMIDSAAARYVGEAEATTAGASTLAPHVLRADQPYVIHIALSATVPITWAVGDEISLIDGWLPMETMYL